MSGLKLRAAVRLLAAPLCLAAGAASAADYDEDLQGDLSNNHLAPTTLLLSYGNAHTVPGSNVITGRFGRSPSGVVDRDYLNFVVPQGHVLAELKIGHQTVVGRNGSFIGLAAGSFTVDPATVSDASDLLGYHIFGPDDFGSDILGAMAEGDGVIGFQSPLGAGSYTLWIQETTGGAFNYRMNLVLAPVPEPASWAMFLGGLLATAGLARRLRT